MEKPIENSLKQVLEHITYFGYSVEAIPEDPKTYHARHPRLPDYVVWPVHEGIYFMAQYRSKEGADLSAYCWAVNQTTFCQFASVNKQGVILFQAWYPIPYSRESFSNWWRQVQLDWDAVLEHELTEKVLR